MPRSCTAALFVAIACGCGSQDPPPAAPIAQPHASGHAHRKAPAAKKTRELVEPPEPDPEAQKVFFATLGAPVVAFRDDRIPNVTLLALENTALGQTRGMVPIGPVRAVELREGQRATDRVSIAPSGCLTVLAEGGLGVAEVDLFLTAGSGVDLKVVAEDTHGGPIGVIGGEGRCFPNLDKAPRDLDLHVTVRRGAGVVLVRGFRR